ncbi:MAG: nitrogen fixation protein NifB, partial [Planctomycetes bacterium]|nr:nitrogen fixation protein NifB [Planctomycetota bacterium]
NGLVLAAAVPGLVAAGVQTLTVTVNAVEPAILERLCAGVEWNGRFLAGRAGAERLIASQREGILLARALGILVKINLVMVPGVNDHHIDTVAATVADWGASFLNIIPLLPAAEFAGAPAPTAAAVERARDEAEWHLPVIRHCRRCRADACGVPGVSDFAHELYRDFEPVETFSHG